MHRPDPTFVDSYDSSSYPSAPGPYPQVRWLDPPPAPNPGPPSPQEGAAEPSPSRASSVAKLFYPLRIRTLKNKGLVRVHEGAQTLVTIEGSTPTAMEGPDSDP